MKNKRSTEMQYREVALPDGRLFNVPEHINRMDTRKTHGWQIRYGKTTKDSSFSDGPKDGGGAKASLQKATEALLARIHKIEAPHGLRQINSAIKTSELPTGISGPQERSRKNKNFKQYSFQVSIPRYGKGSGNKSVYIGTENTIDQERVNAALKKAVQIRLDAENAYQRAATAAIRAKHPENAKT